MLVQIYIYIALHKITFRGPTAAAISAGRRQKATVIWPGELHTTCSTSLRLACSVGCQHDAARICCWVAVPAAWRPQRAATVDRHLPAARSAANPAHAAALSICGTDRRTDKRADRRTLDRYVNPAPNAVSVSNGPCCVYTIGPDRASPHISAWYQNQIIMKGRGYGFGITYTVHVDAEDWFRSGVGNRQQQTHRVVGSLIETSCKVLSEPDRHILNNAFSLKRLQAR